ncbi:MAG: flagellar hook-associated protein FlgK [Succinivibrionaceae bacterium]|nr:flagellar hook-associated protein FlgK [Succinivibrionaceae bacterium]
MSDLLRIGESGVLAHNTLLGTTSNNISNVSTKGYTRQVTNIYTNVVNQGCGRAETTRVIDTYSQKELLRDNAQVGYYSTYNSSLSTVDKLLSDNSTGLSPTITSLFSSIQSANTNPTSIANRNELMGSVETYVKKVNTLSQNIQTEYLNTNKKIEETVEKVNQLLDGIYTMNNKIIRANSSSSDNSSYLQMMDDRDRLITELSEYMDIKTVKQDNGSVLVNMSSGQTLVLGDGCATLAVSVSNLDDTEYGLKFTYGGEYTTLRTDVGGQLQGLFDSCSQLKDTQRDLGKVAVCLADSLNQQNSSGLTLENKIGGDIFKLPRINVSSTSTTASMTMDFVPGKTSNLTGNDYLLTFKDGNYSLYEKVDGEYVKKDDATFKVDGNKINCENYGFSLNINGTVSNGDSFLVQPTMDAGFDMEVAITHPEDFAFASAIRGSQDSQNVGNAKISINGVTNTSAGSAFTKNADETLTLNDNAPSKIIIDKDGNYKVYDSKNNLLGTASNDTNGRNILANLKKDDGSLVFPNYETTPGYDFSITGTVKGGDTFTLSINNDGFADNSNGILMQDIEQKKIVNDVTSRTATESYSALVSKVGTEIKVGTINYDAAVAKQEQTKSLTESASGVDLNEEAANLVRYQQCYAASAKIISAAQTIFDALLSAA